MSSGDLEIRQRSYLTVCAINLCILWFSIYQIHQFVTLDNLYCQFLSPFIFLQDSWEWGALLPLSVSSQSNRLLWRQKRAAPPAAVDKILSGGRLLPGNCLSVFQCVPQELPSILPLCAAQIAYFARTRLRIKLCHVLHAQTRDFLCLLWTPCHVLVFSYYAGFIKAFSNEPLRWPISDQSVVRGLSVGASLPLFLALVSRTWLVQTYIKWVQYGRAGCIWGQSVGGKTIKPVTARGNLH